MTETLTGQHVLVIGGARFLGAAIAERARAEGATVTIASHTPSDAPDRVHIDFLDERTIAAAAQRIGAVDHVVSLASLPHDVPIGLIERDSVVAALEAKVIGPLLVAKHFEIRRSLLLFSGVVGWRPGPASTIKGIANGAVSFAATHLAAELAPVRVNAISPGIIDSGAWDAKGDAKSGFLAGAAGRTRVGRTGTLEDITDAAMWLLTAGYVTGETIHIEGGRA
ncbi:SDR family oxidoreductase [Glaciihabitans sp. dw_435]|uniref:SDR family oxidoreductase n=1 Tax=Glaciihabitans sp. dw_435 TaxID=2720081 RepID=UPI001BD21EFB|nr:SDR family oxidoreductase [Glaciihabitans sp. dw_435]